MCTLVLHCERVHPRLIKPDLAEREAVVLLKNPHHKNGVGKVLKKASRIAMAGKGDEGHRGRITTMTKRYLAPCETETDQYWWGTGRLWGLVLLVLVVGGCTEWTIPPCTGTFKTPCVGPCNVAVEPVDPNSTRVTVPLAVVIQDQQGTRHCQQIQP